MKFFKEEFPEFSLVKKNRLKDKIISILAFPSDNILPQLSSLFEIFIVSMFGKDACY